MFKNPARKYWNDRDVTDESFYRSRRQILGQFAAAGGATIAGGAFGSASAASLSIEDISYHIPEHKLSESLYPAKASEIYTKKNAKRPLSEKGDVFSYNNFYEFSLTKEVTPHVGEFEPFPWEIEVTGLCDHPRKWDIDEMLKAFSLEERVYRFRCVEAWAMTVPWTGFPLKSLIEKASPNSRAKYVKFTSFLNPRQARGQKYFTDYQWPYYEGLHVEEALNPTAFVVTGVYGKQLPKQNGSPIRIVLPWKYGYKGPKSIVKIEFTDERPATFWNDAIAREYGFYSNVDPKKPHARWSQATERILGTNERVPTRLYNGYQEELENLHKTLYKGGEVF